MIRRIARLWYAGMNTAEIAKKCNVSEFSVYNALSLARRTFRDEMREGSPDDETTTPLFAPPSTPAQSPDLP